MKVFVKETLYVLDYKDDIVDMIFTSDDHRTPGYAYNINIEESNMGYSNLTFTMPTKIMEMPNALEDAPASEELVPNPKLKLLTPLVKLRYHRQVIYTGEETIYVQEPTGYGDTTIYEDREYKPNDIVENYIMDYIVQPLNKKRSGYEVNLTFNAIDYPRFNLSKKKFGLTINDQTITRDDWSIYTSEPMSIPGTVQYVKWTQDMSNAHRNGGSVIPTSWDPSTATDYPLTIPQIEHMLKDNTIWPYGLAATVYWWPIAKTARYEGVLYSEGDYLTLQIYPKFETGTADTSLIEHNLDFYGYEWLYLEKGDSYLTPNNACNYLNWALETTNWEIKSSSDKYVGSFFTKNFPASGEVGQYLLYKTINSDEDYIGTFAAVNKLPSGYTSQDLGKWGVVGNYVYSWDGYKWYKNYRDKDYITTQVYEYDGKNWIETKAYWTHSIDKKTGVLYDVDAVETEIAKPDQSAGELFETAELVASLSASDSNCYNVITEIAKTFQLYPVFDCINRKVSLKLFCGKNYGLTYALGHSLENTAVKEDGDKVITKLYSFGGQDTNGNEKINLGDAERAYRKPSDDPDNRDPWDPNAPEYIQQRSPYGTNYIYNFKWMYDNGWMSRDQILGLYGLNQQIQDLNKKFLDAYTTDYLKTNDEYVNAGVVYSTNQDEYLACITSMMNTYYRTPGETTEKFTAFPAPPSDCYKKDGRYYLDVYHCYTCGATQGHAFTGGKCTTPGCKGTPEKRTIHINTWEEEKNISGTTSEQWNPSSKGFYQQVYEQLGEGLREHIKLGVKFIEKPIDDLTKEKKFEINGTEVYDKSANLYNWNDYIGKWVEFYGYSLDNEVEVNRLQHRVEILDESYRVYEKDLEELENQVQDEYGDYIIEGKFNDEEIVYPAILLAKTLEASEQYSIPETTYNLSVIDSSGLIEYRAPQLEVYNELVHTLHSIGQIIPKAGDYVTIYDEPMGLYGVPGLITTIKRVIDNPQSNSITVDTSYTDNEELVGNIITATNTVLSNSDIYARTAVLKSDGTIQGAALTKTLEENSGENITFVGVKGSTLLDSNGLLVTNSSNAERKMKYTGAGVFGTVDNGMTYEPMLTPEGINANYVSAGSIDTQKVQIMSGMYGAVVLDNHGLSVKDNIGKGYKLPTKSKTIEGVDFLDWSGSNLKAFIGVDNENKGQIYLNGQMQIDGGSTIAGWNVLPNKLSSGSGSSYVALSSGGSAAFWAGDSDPAKAKFRIGHDGTLYSSTVDGKIETTEGKITTEVGERTKADGALSSRIEQTISSISLSVGNKDKAGSISLSVTKEGGSTATSSGLISSIVLTADKVELNGGTNKIGGWVIKDDYLGNMAGTQDGSAASSNYFLSQNGKYAWCSMNGGASDNFYLFFKDQFAVTTAGKLYAKNVGISGTITGSTITGGSINISKSGYSFSMGVDTDHPKCSGLNVGSGGINFNGTGGGIGINANSNKTRIIVSSGLNTPYLSVDNDATISGDMTCYGLFKTNNIGPGGNLNAYAGGYVRISSGGLREPQTLNSGNVYIFGGNVNLKASSGNHVYAGAVGWNDGSNAQVETNKGTVSSRSTKTNITPMGQDSYKDALRLLKKMNLYTYDYKYDLYDNKAQYGFIIDEIEEEDKKHNFFNITSEKAWTRGRYIDFDITGAPKDDKDVEVIDVKNYNRDAFTKYLLTCIKGLQQEIEQLKKEKTL